MLNSTFRVQYDSSELLEALEVALDADDPTSFPLPNPHNILLTSEALSVHVNMLFRRIKDECHLASGRDPELRANRSVLRAPTRSEADEARADTLSRDRQSRVLMNRGFGVRG